MFFDCFGDVLRMGNVLLSEHRQHADERLAVAGEILQGGLVGVLHLLASRHRE